MATAGVAIFVESTPFRAFGLIFTPLGRALLVDMVVSALGRHRVRLDAGVLEHEIRLASVRVGRKVIPLTRSLDVTVKVNSSVAEHYPHGRRGEVFQTVLSQRFSMPMQGDPFTVYRALRLENPSPHMPGDERTQTQNHEYNPKDHQQSDVHATVSIPVLHISTHFQEVEPPFLPPGTPSI